MGDREAEHLGARAGSLGALRVLVLSPTLPWPLDAGGRIRTYYLLRELSRKHEVHLWAVRGVDSPGDAGERVSEVCSELRLFDGNSLPVMRRLAAPRKERWFHSRALGEALRSEVGPEAFDLIHLDEPCQLRDLPGTPLPPLLVHHHKLDLEYAQALEGAIEVERWRLLESELLERCVHHVFCSEEDRARFGERHPRAIGHVVESGVDLDFFAPHEVERETRRLLCLGSLDYEPNALGLRRFLASGWPSLRSRFPDLQLDLVGRAPEALGLSSLPAGVELVGAVEDVRPWLARATALVVPLEVGGGTRLKIVEALAMECPVISTDIGLEGLDLDDDRHVLRAHDLNGLPSAITRGLERPEVLSTSAHAGAARVRERYGWPRLSKALSAAYAGLKHCEEHAAK